MYIYIHICGWVTWHIIMCDTFECIVSHIMWMSRATHCGWRYLFCLTRCCFDTSHTRYAAGCNTVLQYGAVCCSVLQCVAMCCSVLQCVAVRCSVLHFRCRYRPMHSNYTVMRCGAVRCNVLQCVAVCGGVVQCVAFCCIEQSPASPSSFTLHLVAVTYSVLQCVKA